MMADEAGNLRMERYSRQILFAPLGRSGQEKLLRSKVALIGLGALGTVSANTLARAGVGFLRLVDRDYVEPSNLQRQILFTEEDAALSSPKAVAAREKLMRVNSGVAYEARICDLNHANVEEIIGDVDLVLDATDNFETRLLLNEACLCYGKPWIYGAVVAAYGMTFTVIPGKTACLNCLWGDLPVSGAAETCDTAGVLGPIVNIIASLQAMEALKLLSGNTKALNRNAFYIDLWQNHWLEISISSKGDCAVCAQKNYRYLSGELERHIAYLCGREAFQVLPPPGQALSLERLKERLSPLGRVSGNEYLIKFSIDRYEMVVFSDGRAIIKGTSDPKTAKSLYARYIGS